MKIYFTFLSLCLFTCASLAQTQQLSDKAETIKQFLTQAKTDSYYVTIKIKPGERLGDFMSTQKPFPNGKTLTGEIVYVSDVGFCLTRILGERTDFIYFEAIAEAQYTDKATVEWSKFGNSTTKGLKKGLKKTGEAIVIVSLPIIALPLVFTGVCGPCGGCIWD